MIFSANTQELIEGLNVVTHAIPARAANKSMECVLMESFDNELSLTCTDGSVIIQTYVKAHTAPYKYPRIVVFRQELPKTVSGKIIRSQL